MFSSEISLLDLASTAPDPSLSSGTVDDGEFIERLVLGGYDETSGTYGTIGRYSNSVVYASTGGDGIDIANRGRFDTLFKKVSA
jgi:hypothetical protein